MEYNYCFCSKYKYNMRSVKNLGFKEFIIK